METLLLTASVLFVEIVKERKKLFKINPFAWWDWGIVLALVVSGVFTAIANEESKQEINELKGEVKALDSTNRAEQQRHENNLIASGERNTKYTTHAIQETANQMAGTFAESIKRGDYNTKTILTNTDDNTKKLSGKMDSSGMSKNPAYIELLREPTNVLRLGIEGDDIKGRILIENSGDFIAYNVEYMVYIVVTINKKAYRAPFKFISKPQNLSGKTGRITQILMTKWVLMYKEIEDIYCIIFGKYFLDEDLKKEKKIELCRVWDTKLNESYMYNLPTPLEEFYGNAKPFLVMKEEK